MERVFFEELCPDLFSHDDQDNLLKLRECECDGTAFRGMPDVDFALEVDEYDTRKYYVLEPTDYEMFPKISVSYL